MRKPKRRARRYVLPPAKLCAGVTCSFFLDCTRVFNTSKCHFKPKPYFSPGIFFGR